ncbi:MAG: hypothetical protein KKA73_14105 [Chloroflexi bacterium]|nr:hypothetical protein [Chloroflexota bacterium]MBU1748818.1 hypothetical protein [Chloroflexota bacterium]
MSDAERPEKPGTICPSCGRFVGAREVCPNCGANVPRRMSLRLFRYGAVALAVVGLLVLWVAATFSQVPTVYVGNIVGTMNWAYVHMEGVVTRIPAYDAETGYLSFWLYDDTGDIMVSAYRAEAQALVDQGKVPMLGDRVSVEGTLKVKEDFAYLTVGVPERVLVTRPEAADMPIGDITYEHEWQRVRVRAVVRQVRQPYEGLTVVELRDGSGVIDLSIEDAMVNLKGQPAEVQPGQSVEVVAPVSLYKEEPQLALVDPAELVVIDTDIPLAETVPIDRLSVADVDRFVRVAGTVTQVEPFSAGVKFTVEDDTGTIVALVWQSVYEGVADREFLTEGAKVAFQGLVSEYREELEIAPEQPMDVVLVKAGAGAATAPISSLTAGQVGETVRVEGQVAEVKPFSQGTKLAVDDGTGRITVTLWQDVYDLIPDRDRLAVGVRVSVQGKLSEYQGTLEIAPRRGTDVIVLMAAGGQPTTTVTPVTQPTTTPGPAVTATPTPTPTTKPVAQTVSLAKLPELKGQTVTVEAQVTKAESFSQGMKYTLSDGTGTAILLLWQDIYNQVPDKARLGVGVKVRATGVVEEFQGDWEVIPENGADVQVTGGQAAPTPKPAAAAPIGSIEAGMAGQTVTIDGYITSEFKLSTGMKYTVDDGTGTIILIVWNNVYEAMPDKDKLVKGARVRVTGKVEVYKGDLEVIPQTGTDVIVVQ